jgi:hypothetical protein
MFAQLRESARAIGKLLQGYSEEIARSMQAATPVLRAVASIDWSAWWERQRTAFLACARVGWFIQPEAPLGFAADVAESASTTHEQLDAFFVEWTRSNLDEVENRLTVSFPERAPLLAEAFALHREARYLASIPLLLICAEGLVQDCTNKSPFSTLGEKPAVAAWSRDLSLESLDRLLADSLAVPHPLSQHEGDSRHAIQHGRAVAYGSEIASLKAVSFLGFVGWLFCPQDGPLVKAAQKAGWEKGKRGWQPPRGRT